VHCAVLFDLEPGGIDAARASPLGETFRPDILVNENAGAGNNFAKGHCTEGAETIGQILKTARMEAENTDCLQGFPVCQSVGGGNGSSMSTRAKPLTAASSRCKRARSLPHFDIPMHGRKRASRENLQSLHDYRTSNQRERPCA
jgi:hypothetical protein